MIVLKILLWIILAVLGIILLILWLPIRAEAAFLGNKLTYKLKYSFLLLYDSDKRGLIAWYLRRKKKKDTEAGQDGFSPDEDFSEDEDTSDIEEMSTDTVPDTTEKPEEQTSVTPEEAPAEESAPAAEAAEEELPEEEPEKPEKPKKEKHKKKKKEKDEIEFPKTLIDKADFVLDIWRAADRPILRIFKGVKLHELYIDFIIANEDAYKCALNYGRISGAAYNVLGWLGVLFNVKLKTVDINAGFGLDKSRWDASGKLSVRPITVVIAGAALLITYLFRYFIPYKLQERKLKKQAVRQK